MSKLMVGNPVLIVIDMQRGGGMPYEQSGIPTMAGFEDRVRRIRTVVDASRKAKLPIVFFAELHRRSRVDFGRELDGDESIHCLEGERDSELVDELKPEGDNEYLIGKRRYSCFFGTDLEILLKGLKAETVILTGELTDVCVHYTFVDGHQHDYRMRVVTDCVGGSTKKRHEASLDAMRYLQRDALTTSGEIITAIGKLKPAARKRPQRAMA